MNPLLVDARTGIVTRTYRYAPPVPMPPAWTGVGAQTADTRAFGPWSADRYGFGAALDDPARAAAAAVGEAVERYCGNAIPAELEVGPWRPGDLDPERLALYSPRQYATPGFPFVPFTRDLPVAWVPGRDLRTGAPARVPASLAYLTHPQDPPVHAMPYSGIAAGPTREAAERSALDELLERDALTLWWAAGAPATALDPDLAARLTGPDPERTVRLLRIPSEFEVPVVAAFLEAPGMVAFGSACRADPVEAAAKALAEAYAMLAMTAEVADPDSDLWRSVARGDLPAHTFRPHRADRHYEFRADLRDLVDLPTLAQYYLDPRRQGAPLDRLRVAWDPAAPPSDPGRPFPADLPAYSVDLTTPDVRLAGMHVVRVVVPGLYGNAPAAFPHRGGDRLHRVPADRGWIAAPTDEDTLYPHPLPQI